MSGVRSDDELPVELWRCDRSGRLVVRAYNEAGCSYTEVDLWDLVGWLQAGHQGFLVASNDTIGRPAGNNSG